MYIWTRARLWTFQGYDAFEFFSEHGDDDASITFSPRVIIKAIIIIEEVVWYP